MVAPLSDGVSEMADTNLGETRLVGPALALPPAAVYPLSCSRLDPTSGTGVGTDTSHRVPAPSFPDFDQTPAAAHPLPRSWVSDFWLYC
jgi:hypothetical protein